MAQRLYTALAASVVLTPAAQNSFATITLVGQIDNPTPDSGDLFGRSVASNGDFAVSGVQTPGEACLSDLNNPGAAPQFLPGSGA